MDPINNKIGVNTQQTIIWNSDGLVCWRTMLEFVVDQVWDKHMYMKIFAHSFKNTCINSIFDSNIFIS